jgi:hypothetical protein
MSAPLGVWVFGEDSTGKNPAAGSEAAGAANETEGIAVAPKIISRQQAANRGTKNRGPALTIRIRILPSTLF